MVRSWFLLYIFLFFCFKIIQKKNKLMFSGNGYFMIKVIEGEIGMDG